MAAPRKKHQSRSVERHFDRPRSAVWPLILAAVDSSPAEPLAIEAPWRLCSEDAGSYPDLDFFQGTFVIRDDGPTCHVSWGLVFDPEPTEAGLAAAESALAETAALLDRLAGY